MAAILRLILGRESCSKTPERWRIVPEKSDTGTSVKILLFRTRYLPPTGTFQKYNR
jgi:hypothetical protein